MKRTVKKPSERRADIVRAAGNLFQTQEYEKTTMQNVIDELGIAKGTIYHYFPSKEALLEAVVEDLVDTAGQQLQARLNAEKGNALDKMQVFVTASNVAADNQNVLQDIHKPGNEALHTRLLAVTIIKLAPSLAQIINQGCTEGIFKTETPLECAEFILAGIQFLIDEGIYPWSKKDVSRRIDAFPRLIEQLLKAPGGSFQFITKDFER